MQINVDNEELVQSLQIEGGEERQCQRIRERPALSTLRIYWKSFLSVERRIGRISFHWKRLRKRKKVEWNWNQGDRVDGVRKGGSGAVGGWAARIERVELGKIRKSVERKKNRRKEKREEESEKSVANQRFCFFKSLPGTRTEISGCQQKTRIQSVRNERIRTKCIPFFLFLQLFFSNFRLVQTLLKILWISLFKGYICSMNLLWSKFLRSLERARTMFPL